MPELEMYSARWFEYQQEIGPLASEASRRWHSLNHQTDGEEFAFLRQILGLPEETVFENLWADHEEAVHHSIKHFGQSYEPKVTYEQARRLWEEYKLLFYQSAYHRETVTSVALSLSLCPLHFVDYAICFDDDEPQCAAIREVHPTHDT